MKVFIDAGFKISIGTIVAFIKISGCGSANEYSVLPIIAGTMLVVWGTIDIVNELSERTQ